MQRKLIVFVSSYMNSKIDDLTQERKTIIKCIKELEYFELWAFENEPASSNNVVKYYLNGVEECDLFLLLLKKVITKPVKKEIDTAKKSEKPMLIFLYDDAQSKNTKRAINNLKVKYKKFYSLNELKKEVKRALINELVTAYKSGSLRKIINKEVRFSNYYLLLLRNKKTGKIEDIILSKPNSKKAYEYIKDYERIRIPASRLLRLILDNLESI